MTGDLATTYDAVIAAQNDYAKLNANSAPADIAAGRDKVTKAIAALDRARSTVQVTSTQQAAIDAVKGNATASITGTVDFAALPQFHVLDARELQAWNTDPSHTTKLDPAKKYVISTAGATPTIGEVGGNLNMSDKDAYPIVMNLLFPRKNSDGWNANHLTINDVKEKIKDPNITPEQRTALLTFIGVSPRTGATDQSHNSFDKVSKNIWRNNHVTGEDDGKITWEDMWEYQRYNHHQSGMDNVGEWFDYVPTTANNF